MKIIQPKTILIASLLALVLFFSVKKIRAPSSGQQFNPKIHQTVKPTRHDISQTLILAGLIDAENKTNLTFPASGKLVWIGAKIGDHVKRGQAIASLDKTELQKQYQQLMNDYLTNRWLFEDTQNQYKTAKEQYLLTDDIKRILERSQFSLNNSVLNVELKNLAVKNATIVSPLDGILVASNQPVAGVNVTPLNTSFSVVDMNSIYFRAKIDQEDVTKINTGQPTTITLDSFPDQTVDSQITYIAYLPVEGETSTVYEIRFSLPPNEKYRLGMDGNANIIISSSLNALTLPSEAVIQQADQYFVNVKQVDQLVKKRVDIGIETDLETEIKSGILDTDEIVLTTKR